MGVERRGLDGVGFLLRAGLDEAVRVLRGQYEVALSALRTHPLALDRSRRKLEEMRREVLRDHSGARPPVKAARFAHLNLETGPQGHFPDSAHRRSRLSRGQDRHRCSHTAAPSRAEPF